MEYHVALNPLRTCFLCKIGVSQVNENGRNSVLCIHDHGEYMEEFLPNRCNFFEYKDTLCAVCSKKMSTPTFMQTAEGLIPICSQPCTKDYV